jgi:type I restriction enzyme S subunit
LKTVPIRALASDLLPLTDGDWVELPHIRDSGIRLLQTGNIGVGEFIDKGYRFIDDITMEELGCTPVVPGDVLICRLADPVGRACLAPDLGVPMVTSVDVAILRPRSDAIAPYLVYFFSSKEYLPHVASIARGGTRTRVSRSQLGSIRVSIPHEATQHKIADFLDRETERIDALIDKKRRLIDLLEEKRTAPMKPTSIPWIGEIPEHWGETHVIRLARLGSGHTPSRRHPEWWEDCTIPWITTGEVRHMRSDRIEHLTHTRENVSEVVLENSAGELHPKGTVVLSRTASAWFSAIMGADMATSQDPVTWTCDEQHEPRFLLLCLRATRRDLLARLAQGSTHKTIYMPDIISIKVPVPPIDEQQQIVDSFWDRATSIDRAIDSLNGQLPLLAAYREALITAAVTGEIDVDTFDTNHTMEETRT